MQNKTMKILTAIFIAITVILVSVLIWQFISLGNMKREQQKQLDYIQQMEQEIEDMKSQMPS